MASFYCAWWRHTRVNWLATNCPKRCGTTSATTRRASCTKSKPKAPSVVATTVQQPRASSQAVIERMACNRLATQAYTQLIHSPGAIRTSCRFHRNKYLTLCIEHCNTPVLTTAPPTCSPRFPPLMRLPTVEPLVAHSRGWCGMSTRTTTSLTPMRPLCLHFHFGFSSYLPLATPGYASARHRRSRQPKHCRTIRSV